MFNKRIDNVLKRMENKDYDGMFLTQYNNISYISNYFPTSFAICILKEDPIILTSAMDIELANKTSNIPVKEFESFSQIKKIFNDENLKKIAIESSLPIHIYKKIEGSWDLAIEDLLELERMIKSFDEISKIQDAVDISHKSFKELNILEKYENNFTEWEIAHELLYLMKKNGAQEESFETIVATGRNSSLPHAKCENKKIEMPILMDWGCKYKGYCSDTSRTMVHTKKQEEIFEIVLEAYNSAINHIKPGIKACEIDDAARSIISEYGYADNFIHSTGHSLGLNIHEKPSISKKDTTTLEKNMIITVEPGIYFEGDFGVRIEDMVLVDKKGKIMGNLPTTLY